MLPQTSAPNSDQLYSETTVGLLDKYGERVVSVGGKKRKGCFAADSSRGPRRGGQRDDGQSSGDRAPGMAQRQRRRADIFRNPGRSVYSTSSGPSPASEKACSPTYVYQLPDLSEPVPQLFGEYGMYHYIVDGYTVRVVALNVTASGVPNLDSA